MILGEPSDVVLQRVEPGGGEHASLAHATADHLAQAPRLADECLATAEHRPHRRTEPLGQNTPKPYRNAG